ncbi:MAG: hypothetical protein JWM11_4923, partial [Planctomycetaceae bacterium]|nr:hypothetical protein [Planctomycetaceae bacterium]
PDWSRPARRVVSNWLNRIFRSIKTNRHDRKPSHRALVGKPITPRRCRLVEIRAIVDRYGIYVDTDLELSSAPAYYSGFSLSVPIFLDLG